MSPKEAMDAKGYLIQKGFFQTQELQPLLARLISYFKTINGGPDRDLSWAELSQHVVEMSLRSTEKRRLFYSACQLAPELGIVSMSSRLHALLGELGFQNPVLKNMNMRFDIASNTDFFLVDWHQDINNLKAGLSVTVWIPLQDLTPRIGGMEILEMEQFERVAQPTLPEEKQDYFPVDIARVPRSKPATLRMSMGDVLIFDPHLPHKSLRGEDGSLRWTLIMRFDCLNTFHEITGKTPSVESTNIPDPYLQSRNAQGLFPTE